MSRCVLPAWLAVALTGIPASAQVPFAHDLVPTRTALSRVGLERQWTAVVPLVNHERVLSISLSGGLFFAQTNRANFYVFDAETGQMQWSARLGDQTARARGASVNSFAVFATNLNRLFAMDRRTGRTIWEKKLDALPASTTICDEDRVMVGLFNGKIYAYGLKVKEKEGSRLSDKPLDDWNWQTSASVETQPLPAGKMVAFGSDDGKVYVAMADEPTMLYRIATSGAIGAGLGAYGTRMLLIPSADNNLYAVDLLTSHVFWTFASGAPIKQAPLVAGHDVFVANAAGQLTSLEPNTGAPRWTVTSQGGRFIAVGARRIYLETHDLDLFIIDRATGQTVVSPRAAYQRAGLDLRGYELAVPNRQNDRLYLGTASGMLLCLREIGQTAARPLRDSKELPFGYIPREGIPLTPPVPTPPATAPAPAPNPAPPPAEGEKPQGETETPPK